MPLVAPVLKQAGAQRVSQPPTPTDNALAGDARIIRPFRNRCQPDYCRCLGTAGARVAFLRDREHGMDRSAEIERLGEADRHVCEAERAVGHQLIEIDRLREGGHSTVLAEQMLETFRRTLHELQAHRNMIIKTIEKIDAGWL